MNNFYLKIILNDLASISFKATTKNDRNLAAGGIQHDVLLKEFHSILFSCFLNR